MFYWIGPLILITFQGIIPINSHNQEFFQGDFWKKQAVEDIMKPWHVHSIDLGYGAFYSHLDRSWDTFNGHSKFPGMVARHLFSYSAAYMMTGEEDYMDQADDTWRYLMENGWDREYGGWYTELDRTGKVIDSDKDLFMQTYAITGLTMYFLVTRDPEVKSIIDRSIGIIEKYAWDHEHGGGYVNRLHRDLSLKDAGKKFSPQLAPLSGYLLYLYCATRESKYLEMSERIIETVLERMYDKKSGWIMEGFQRDWTPLEKDNIWMNSGHNIEVAWMLMRLYEFNGKESYRTYTMELNRQLLNTAFDRETGFWHHKVRVDDPEIKSNDASWWVQAYGNMFQAYLYHVTRDEEYLINFRKGAEFWNNSFIDKEFGGACISVDKTGNVLDGRKAVRTKTSYHSIEHALLNFLYLDFWIDGKPVTLYFNPINPAEEKWYPLPLEDTTYQIETVLYRSGIPAPHANERGFIELPHENREPLEIRIRDL